MSHPSKVGRGRSVSDGTSPSIDRCIHFGLIEILSSHFTKSIFTALISVSFRRLFRDQGRTAHQSIGRGGGRGKECAAAVSLRSDAMRAREGGRDGGGLAACPPPRRRHHVRKGTTDARSRNLPSLLLSSDDADSDRTPEPCTGVTWFRERPAEVSGRRFATASPKLVGIIFAPTCGR